MANPELGTKRICPETGRKFYDLNHNPIVSPYTGKSYPLSFFEDTVSLKESKAPKERKAEEEEDGENKAVEIVSLEDADEENAGKNKGEDIPDIDADDDDEISDNDDTDTFLESDDEDDDDVSGLIGGRSEDEEES